MKRLFLAAAMSAAFVVPAFAETVDDVKPAAMASCVKDGTGDGKSEADATAHCTCIIDALVANVDAADIVTLLKILAAEDRSEEGMAKAGGVSAEEANALMARAMEKAGEKAGACEAPAPADGAAPAEAAPAEEPAKPAQ